MTEAEIDALAAQAECLFRERLRFFAARRLGSVNEADDVAQEAIRRALEALRAGRIENVSALPAFLFQTAKNICLQRLRSAHREGRALRRLAASGGQSSEDPLGRLIRDELREAVRRGLEKLEPGDRDLLQMTYGQELDTEEIGRRLGITSGAVRVRRHRAIRRLSEHLDVTAAAKREHRD